MSRRSGDRESLAERTARSRAADAPDPSVAPGPAFEPSQQPGRHVWVTTAAGRHAGLLLEWRQADKAWRGRVVHAVREGQEWVVVEEWLGADVLTPA